MAASSDKQFQAQYLKTLEDRQEKSDKSWHEWSLKVLEEITTLNSKTEQLAKDLDTKYNLLQKSIDDSISSIGTKIDSINDLLNGAGGSSEKGLIVRVDRLEQTDVRRAWMLRATITACIGAVITTIFNLLSR